MSYLVHSMRTLDTKPQIQRNDFATHEELQAFLQFTMIAIVINTPLVATPQVRVISMVKKLVDYINIRSLLDGDFTTSRGIRISMGVTSPITVSAANEDWALLPDSAVAVQMGGDSGAVKDGSTIQIASMFKRLSENLLELDFKVIR